uniref:Uncharacterized protein n=1 Tax=Tanacetum cinerariifolium TaxID=118510 RepID=A0A699IVA3_TANCI|nr:hypothetical protein [Tanacetum cinerariifolium]
MTSLLRFYQNDDISPWGNCRPKREEENGPKWSLEHRKGMHQQFSQIFSTIKKSKIPDPEASTFAITTRSGKSKIPDPEASTFAITTRSGVSTRDPLFLTPLQSTPANHAEGATEKEGPEGAKSSIMQDEEVPQSSVFYQPSKSLNRPLPSRVKKQKKDDEDERLISIFKQIHINLRFLEAMIHMSKEANVLKDLLLHKEKLKKAAFSVKLSVECSAII